jgi:septal ring factor EnvC (AmiA/AmiB activator)
MVINIVKGGKVMKFQILSVVVIAFLVLGVSGFSATDQQLKQVQDELTKTKAVLADVQKENDALKAELAKVKTEQPSATAIRDRDNAIQAAAAYQSDYANALDQLQDQASKNLILQQQVYDQQYKIYYLLHRLDGATVMPSPGFNSSFGYNGAVVTMPSPSF